MPDAIRDNVASSRFETTVDGHTATLTYQRTPQTLTLVHTLVPEPIRRRHIATALVEAAVAAAHAEGLRVVAVCPFAREYMRTHPEASPGA